MEMCVVFWSLLTLGYCLASNEFESCLTEITDKYFTDDFVVVIKWAYPIAVRRFLHPETEVSIENVSIKSLMKRRKWVVSIFTREFMKNPISFTHHHRSKNVLFLMDGKDDTNVSKLAEELKEMKRKIHWRSQGKILAIIRPDDVFNGQNFAKSVLEALWAFTKSCNAAVIVLDTEKAFSVYTWLPYTVSCDTVGTINVIDSWKNGKFEKDAILFLNEGIANLNGCPLRVGAFPIPPYVMLPIGPRNNFTRGLDIKIVQVLSEYYNFTISYITLPEGQFPYIIFDDEGKASGFHAMLQRQELDIMIFGCRIHELRNMLADPLDSYIEDALVWIVPTPGLVPSWRNLGDAFTAVVWSLFGVFFILITVTFYVVANYQGVVEHQSFRDPVSCALLSLGVHLNVSVVHPRGTIFRLFMFIFSLFAINSTSAYQSSLIALLTGNRYEKPYVTPMDAVLGGVKTYLFPSGNLTYNQTDHSMWNIILQPNRHDFAEDFVPVLRQIALEKNAMVMMSQNVATFEIKTKYMTHSNIPRALFLDEKFSSYKVTAYISAGHPLREHFRKKVNQMVEGGLIEFWMNEVVSSSEHQFIGKGEDEGAQPLTIQHLQGAFFIYAVALFGSFQVFILEVILKKNTKILNGNGSKQ